ncbi:PaaI family thioesterase [Candidatus Mycobacterium methanotrophicum]|uniref:PaaI family thioesterase n=2 Tax=Candidatus Mycobacterium methanotrophicum TaxID=2943498 RepID=A0ABY4QN72_9MYCO|nr:PaaI family thioesterase [Candidatus Mycobacterium methanotrophicum]UQX11400.1 PaaI family thioesterase [Candidatus Mycobacterium methanotrophicum]
MSGHALLLGDEFAVTGELHVKFFKPIPIQRLLTSIARVIGRSGREVYVEAELWLADHLLATSHAVMTRRPGSHFTRHRQCLSAYNADPHGSERPPRPDQTILSTRPSSIRYASDDRPRRDHGDLRACRSVRAG